MLWLFTMLKATKNYLFLANTNEEQPQKSKQKEILIITRNFTGKNHNLNLKIILIKMASISQTPEVEIHAIRFLCQYSPIVKTWHWKF